MNETGQPAAPSGHPTVVQQTTVIQVGSRKSVGAAIVLALFFGPLGMLYATVPGACVMFVVNILMLFGTAGIGLLLTVPLGAVWAASAASSHNKGLGAAAQAVAHSTPHSPAGWHPDPSGGDRLRYWDGGRWTEHYSDNGATARGGTSAELQAADGDRGEAEDISCGSCGERIAPGHKFCPGCGIAREATVSE